MANFEGPILQRYPTLTTQILSKFKISVFEMGQNQKMANFERLFLLQIQCLTSQNSDFLFLKKAKMKKLKNSKNSKGRKFIKI